MILEQPGLSSNPPKRLGGEWGATLQTNFQEFIFEVSHKIAYKMTHANLVIDRWFSPPKIRITHNCHKTWIFVGYNTNSCPLSNSVSDTCQEL